MFFPLKDKSREIRKEKKISETKLLLKFAVAFITVFSAVISYAADLPIVSQDVRIPKGKSHNFEFGTVPQKDTTVLLDIMTRIDADKCNGSMYFMKIFLNGRPIIGAKTRSMVRLVNKPLVSPVMPSVKHPWVADDRWMVIYAPDFKEGLKIPYYTDNPYRLTLDVTDLINPLGENHLKIINTCTYTPPAGSKGNYDLVIKSLTVRTKPEASPMMSTARFPQNFINRGEPGRGPVKYAGKLCKGGGFSITVSGQRFDFDSAFSYPDSGLNHLSATDKPESGQKGWTIKVKPTATGGQVIGEGPDYRLCRTVRFTARKVEVSEEITNLHRDQKLGMLVRSEVSLKGKQADVRLAGNPDPIVNEYYAPSNPSVYAQLKDFGLGLICEDDVFRNQATLFCDAKTAGIRTEKLCLKPGGSYTLKWSVYPVATNDYYDFINLVRQDWGANFTVEGAWSFFYKPEVILDTPFDYLRKQYINQGVKYVNGCGGWIDFIREKEIPKHVAFGAGVLDPFWADYRDRLRRVAQRIHKAVPDIKVYNYYNTFRDSSEGGLKRFHDSLIVSPDGNPRSSAFGGDFFPSYCVIPTLENSFGQTMLKAVKYYMEELKCDGLYWDEMELENYNVPQITYNMWDGYSCILTEKYTIERTIAIGTIIGEKFRLAVIDKVRSLGGNLLGNSPACTKKLLLKKMQRMVEIQHNDSWHYLGNLNSPLGYAGHRKDFGNWIRAIKMATLLVGTRISYYDYDFSRYVFPFTPIELHAGYMLGQERIITVHSGNYGWVGKRCLSQVRHFDKNGKLTGKDFPTIVTRDEARTKVELTEGEALVLERLPVIIEPKTDAANVSGVSYSSKALIFNLKTSGEAKVQIANGVLSITPGCRIMVTIGETTKEMEVGKNGVLKFDVEGSGDAVKVEVKTL